jgi:hypothetical protein
MLQGRSAILVLACAFVCAADGRVRAQGPEEAVTRAGANRSLLGPPADLRLEFGSEILRGRAGFGIDADPFESRLDYPVAGRHWVLRADVRPFGRNPRWSLTLEGALQTELTGTTKDTDWAYGEKWLYSRSRTEGTSLRARAGAGFDILRAPSLDFTGRLGVYYHRDVFTNFDLRQFTLKPGLTSPPLPDYEEVSGEISRYEMRTLGLTLEAEAVWRMAPAVLLRFRGAVFPLAYVSGFGNWKLRRYRFQQYGISFFTSHVIGLDLSLCLTPWARVTAGLVRIDWRADWAVEDGQYADQPEYNYENESIVSFMRHLQYGFSLGVSVLL